MAQMQCKKRPQSPDNEDYMAGLPSWLALTPFQRGEAVLPTSRQIIVQQKEHVSSRVFLKQLHRYCLSCCRPEAVSSRHKAPDREPYHIAVASRPLIMYLLDGVIRTKLHTGAHHAPQLLCHLSVPSLQVTATSISMEITEAVLPHQVEN